MKKILLAWIEQVIQFDSEQECKDYVQQMEVERAQKFMKTGKAWKFKLVDIKSDAAGKVFLTIRKQYNNNQFPE